MGLLSVAVVVANNVNRDILLRHEKLVHGRTGDGSRKSSRSSISGHGTASIMPIGLQAGPSFSGQSSPQTESTIARSMSESIPDPTRQFSSRESISHSRANPDLGFLNDHSSGIQFDVVPRAEAEFGNSNYLLPGPGATPEDYNLFLDHFDLANLYLPSSVFDSELPTSLWCRPDTEVVLVSQHRNRPWEEPPQDEQNPLSRFGSRLPSLQPEEQDPIENEPLPRPNRIKADPPWKISGYDHREIKKNLEEFADVLPKGFILPSRHALSQFFEGYISGFHQHLPFLHIPTLVASKCTPELLLAIVAVGAQYRFESKKGNDLWYASRAIAFEQTRRRQSQKVAAILFSTTPKPNTYTRSPVSTEGGTEGSEQSNLGGPQSYAANSDSRDPR